MAEKVKRVCPGIYYYVAISVIIYVVGGFITFCALAMDHDALLGLAIFAGAFVEAMLTWLHMIIAGYLYSAAEDKGYYDPFYLRMCFWLVLVGWLLVIALPDRGMQTADPVVDDDELPDL